MHFNQQTFPKRKITYYLLADGVDSLLVLKGNSSDGTLGKLHATSLTLNVVVEGEDSGISDLLKLGLVNLLNIGKSDNGSLLLVDEVTETSLTLDNDEGDVHLAAESREPDNELNGVNIVSNDDKLGLLGLDEGGDVVKTILEGLGLSGSLDLLALGLNSSLSLETISLSLLGLRAVLAEELEEVGSCRKLHKKETK